MNENIERKNVDWEHDNSFSLDRNLIIKCPYEGNSDFIEMIIKIEGSCVLRKINQLVRFLYNNYPEICWEYVEEMREMCINDRFDDETFVKFLIEIIPDIFPDCHFSINLTKMPETLEEDSESGISKAIEIDVEVDTIDSIGEVVNIKKIIDWLEKKTGFDVILTTCFIRSNFKVKSIM